MKHTEGPWRKVGGSIMDSRGNEVAERKSRKHETKGTGDISPTEADANARLIAEAPELLRLCKLALEVLEEDGTLRVMLQQIMQDTIDRAEGNDT